MSLRARVLSAVCRAAIFSRSMGRLWLPLHSPARIRPHMALLLASGFSGAAVMFCKPALCDRDEDRVEALYRRAASALNDISAESPTRQKQLVSQATTLLEEASALGHLPATILLSQLLLESQLPESRTRGLELLQRAADRGSVASLCRLGGMYLEGEEIAQNVPLGMKMLHSAADRGDSKACALLGQSYWTGEFEGVPEDYPRALALFKQGGELRNAACAYLAAVCLTSGEAAATSDADFKQAFRFLLIAAEQEHADAMGMIAQCYERGIGVAADPVRAREWYDRIATKSILKRSTS